MNPTRADLRQRLYEHGFDLVDETPHPNEQVTPSSASRTRPLSARLASAQQSPSGTVDVKAARRLLGNLRSKGLPGTPRRPHTARATVADPAETRPRSAPRRRSKQDELRASGTPRLPDIAKPVRHNSNTTTPQLPLLQGVEPQAKGSPKAAGHHDPFDVFIDLLRSAQQQEGETEGLEFVYVRYTPGGGPYDVELIPFHAVDQSHYLTVSPHGFTEYVNGRPYEFISLERWLDERQLYRSVHELRFFQEFAKRKSFHCWHDAVSQERMSKASAVLEDRLFMLHPTFRRLLLEVRGLCLQLGQTRVVNIQFPSPKTIPEFSALQRSWRKDVLVNVGELATRLREEIVSTFSGILDRVRKETRGHGTALTTAVFGNRANLSRMGGMAPQASSKARHGLQVKADGEALEALGFPKDIGYGQRSALRKECGRFVRFGQLADLLATDALLELGQGSLIEIVNAVSPSHHHHHHHHLHHSNLRPSVLSPGSSADSSEAAQPDHAPIEGEHIEGRHGEHIEGRHVLQPLFKVEADIAENVNGELADMELWPDKDSLLQTLLNAIEDGCKIMDVFQRLATHGDLEPYRAVLDPLDSEYQPRRQLAGASEDESDMDSLSAFVEQLYQQESWKHTTQQLQTAIAAAFEEANRELNHFDRHVDRCRECLRMDMGVEVSAACDTGSVAGLGGLLEEYEKEVTELHEMPPNLTLEVLDIDISNVKHQLLKGPTKCRRHLHTMLPEMVSHRSAGLFEWIGLCKRQLAAEPTSIDVYVQQASRLEEIEIQVHEQASQLARIVELCKLINLHHIEMSGPGKKQAASVEREFKEFRQWIATKQVEISRLKDHFAGDLQELVDVLARDVETLAVKVNREYFLVLVTEHGEILPDELSPAQSLFAAGKIPQLIIGDKALIDPMLEHDVTDKVSQLHALRDDYDDLRATLDRYHGYQDMLGHDRAKSPALDALQEDLTNRLNLWEAMQSWLTFSSVWMSNALGEISTEYVTRQVALLWAKAREAQGALPVNPIFEELRSYIMLMKDSLPALTALQNPHLKERHMRAISDALQAHLDSSAGIPSLLVGHLVELDVGRRRGEIQGISSRATQEHVIEIQLLNIETTWAGIDFTITQYRPEQRDTCVLGPTDHILAQLDDSLVTVAAILASRAVQVHVENAREWHKKLTIAKETLTEWTLCQQKWKYLDRIFVVSDIQKQLIRESNTFQNIDSSWKQIMLDTMMSPQVLNACLQPGLLENLRQHNVTLDAVEHELNDYLETKRMAFPRFYFLSNEELLTVTAHGREPRVIEQHLQKCFDGICHLDFGDDRNFDILAMISEEGERVALGRLKIRTHIEETFDVIQSTMLAVLRRAVHAALDEAAEKDEEWGGQLANWLSDTAPTQAIHTAARIMWCRAVEESLMSSDAGALASVQQWHESKRLGSLARLSHAKLSTLQRFSILALLTTEVHGRDVLESLVKAGVNGRYSFDWQKQLRYYWEPSEPMDSELVDTCLVRQLDVQLPYSFEYQGVATRLVVTPLTERCWLSITQALQIHQGTAVSGPSGTGKTETIKDLAKSLAILCIVFNCSDQVSCQLTGQLIAGLAQQGCWACLDEFNSVALDVLSVVAQQINRVHQGLLTGRESLEFEGAIIPLKFSAHICITMNPRADTMQDIPDNLQVLFRAVAMASPDLKCISEVLLFAEGFSCSHALSQKVAMLCKMASEQLSNRMHYDFGLRALKSVLVRAGELLQSGHVGAIEEVGVRESTALVHALIEGHGPRLAAGDLDLFQGLLDDLFTERQEIDTQQADFVAVIESTCTSLKLHASSRLITKVLELHAVQAARKGVLLVGPAGSGKSVSLDTLTEALAKITDSTQQGAGAPEVDVLNPKSVSLEELFGSASSKSGEWIHGLLSRTLRKHAIRSAEDVSKIQTLVFQPRPRWVVLDGPVDMTFIESLNTVLDENHILCLSNSERVQLCDDLRIFFECDTLDHASPAMMSRCGAVYYPDAQSDGLEAYLEGWLSGLQDSWLPQASVRKWMRSASKLAMQALQFVIGGSCTTIVPTNSMQMLYAFGQMLNAVLKVKPFRDPVVTPLELDGGSSGDASHYSELFPPPLNDSVPSTLDHDKYIAACVAFSLMWTFGSVLPQDQRTQLNGWCKEHIEHLNLPTGLTLFDVLVDWRASPSYCTPWDRVLPQAPSLSQESYSQLIVPTAAVASHSWVAFLRARQLCHTLIVGTSGSGKTVIATRLLRQPQRIQPWCFADVFFTTSTRADHMQRVLEQRLQQKHDLVLGPPSGTYAMVFIDDVNAPLPDRSGAQAPNELLRQVLDKRGLYERSTWSWQQVEEIAFLAASAPPAAGGSWLSPRVARHFQTVCLPDPSRQALSSIFGSLLVQIFGNSESGGSGGGSSTQSHDLARMVPAICKATVDLFFLTTDALKLTPATPFYAFNLRDVWRVVQGLTTVRPGSGGHFNTGHEIVKLWAHEAMRVFQDRLSCAAHRKGFGSFVDSLLQSHFKTSWRPSQDSPLRYADFMRATAEMRPYEQLQDEQKAARQLQDFISDYNTQPTVTQPLRLVLFSDAIGHLCRLNRALRQHRSHALLVGVTGSGRRSLVALASFIAEARRYPVVAADHTELQDFLKAVVRSCGVRGQSSVITLYDEDILHESFLEDLSSLINVGHIPNMWTAEETESIRRETRNVWEAAQTAADSRSAPGHDGRQRNEMDDPEAPWRLFVSRVRDILRVIMCMSPAGELLRSRCRRIPALVTCCLVDYFDAWPEEALLAVAAAHLDELSGLAVRKGALESLASASVRAHTAALRTAETFMAEDERQVFISPKSHLDLVRIYVDLAAWKRNELERVRGRLHAGLTKLRSSSAHVRDLEQELTALRPRLEEKSEKARLLLEKVAREKARADDIFAAVQVEKENVNNRTLQIRDLREEAKAELEAVMPEFKAAVKAVEKLDKKDIQEIRSFQNPPPLVLTVMQCICMLLGHNTDWVTIKNVISETNFLKRLKDFERDTIPEKILQKLKGYVRREEFDPKEVEKQAPAAKSLCMWCRALNTYSDIAKEVEPKHARLREMDVELADAHGKKEAKQIELDEVLTKVKALEDACERTQEELHQLNTERNRTERHLKCACELTEALKDEENRWVQRSTKLAVDIECLLGDVFVAAAYVAYAGPFTQVHRSKLLSEWLDICQYSMVLRNSNSPWSLERVLAQPGSVGSWQRQGLPADRFSTESAIIMKGSIRFPLCIDPQGQGVRWLRNIARSRGLRIVEASSPELHRALDDCSSNGMPILVLDCQEQLPRCLDPLLIPDRRSSARQLFSEDLQEQEDGFVLYLATSLANPRFLPQVFVAVAVVNFSVGFSGLTEHLLGKVVQLENPQVEMQRDDLAKRMADDQSELDGLAERMLSLLSESEGNILDQNDLIETLSSSKDTAARLAERMEFQKKSEQVLEKRRATYRQVAERGALLYFTAASMEVANQLYACALPQVIQVFTKAIKHEQEQHRQEVKQRNKLEHSDDEDEESQEDLQETLEQSEAYIERLVAAVTQELISFLFAGFFERHRQIAALHFCIELGRLRGQISDVQRQLLLSGSEAATTADGTASAKELTPDALCFPARTWQAIQALARMIPDVFGTLCKEIVDGLDEWRAALALHDPTIAAAMDFRKKVSRRKTHETPSSRAPSKQLLARSKTTGFSRQTTPEREEALFPVTPSRSEPAGEVMLTLAQTRAASEAEEAPADVNASITSIAAETDSLVAASVEDSQRAALCPFFPGKWGSSDLSLFNQLLLLRAVQPLQLHQGLRKFVELVTAGAYVHGLHRNLRHVYEQSASRTPVLIVVGSGANPALELGEEAAKVLGSARALCTVSLGRGQGEKASRVIDDCVQRGLWVLLQNCHLAESWVPILNRFITRTLQSPNLMVQNTFRLFLACPLAPTRLPVELLHQCLKIAYEPPQGVRASLLQAFDDFTLPTWLGNNDTGTGGRSTWDYFSKWPSGRGLLVALTLFHAVLQERQKFGSRGFNRPYDFADGDRRAAQAGLALLLEQQASNVNADSEVPCEALACIVADVHYGGRVIDAFDRRCIQATFANFIRTQAGDSCQDSTVQSLLSLGYHGSLEELRTAAESLPVQDQPEVFGMQANAEILLRHRQAEDVLRLLRTVQSVTISVSSDSPEEAQEAEQEAKASKSQSSVLGSTPTDRQARMAAVSPSVWLTAQLPPEQELLRRLCSEVPQPRDMNDANAERKPAQNQIPLEQCLSAFRDREIECYNRLLRSVHGSLSALGDAMAGRLSMSDNLEEIWAALQLGKVPQAWQAMAYPSCRSLFSWVEDLQCRVRWFWSWADQQELPHCFWLTYFVFPQGFLTTVLQAHARLTGLALDALCFQHEVRSSLGDAAEVKTKAARGVYTYGVYLQGARWDVHSHQLEDLRPGIHVSRVPVLHFIPIARVPTPAAPAEAAPATRGRGGRPAFRHSVTGAGLQKFGTSPGGTSPGYPSSPMGRQDSAGNDSEGGGSSRASVSFSRQVTPDTPAPASKRTEAQWHSRNSQGRGQRLALAGERFECPLYRTHLHRGAVSSTGQSTNDVCSVLFPTAAHPSRWILRGVSLVCEPPE